MCLLDDTPGTSGAEKDRIPHGTVPQKAASLVLHGQQLWIAALLPTGLIQSALSVTSALTRVQKGALGRLCPESPTAAKTPTLKLFCIQLQNRLSR